MVEALKHWKRRHWSHWGRREEASDGGKWEEGESAVALDEAEEAAVPQRPARWNGAEQLELAPTHQGRLIRLLRTKIINLTI